MVFHSKLCAAYLFLISLKKKKIQFSYVFVLCIRNIGYLIFCKYENYNKICDVMNGHKNLERYIECIREIFYCHFIVF